MTTKIDIVPTLPGATPSPGRRNEYPDVWAEIPPNSRVCPHTGLKHAKLYCMLSTGGIARRFVRVANLRDPDATQGKTLFHLGDMLRFLDAVAAKQGSGQDRDRLAEIA